MTKTLYDSGCEHCCCCGCCFMFYTPDYENKADACAVVYCIARYINEYTYTSIYIQSISKYNLRVPPQTPIQSRLSCGP